MCLIINFFCICDEFLACDWVHCRIEPSCEIRNVFRYMLECETCQERFKVSSNFKFRIVRARLVKQVNLSSLFCYFSQNVVIRIIVSHQNGAMCKVVWFLCLRCKFRAAFDVDVCEGIWSNCESLIEERNFMTSCENCEDQIDDVVGTAFEEMSLRLHDWSDLPSALDGTRFDPKFVDLSDLPKFCTEYFERHFSEVKNNAKYEVHFHGALKCTDWIYELVFTVDTPLGYFMSCAVNCETDLESMFNRLREVSQVSFSF